MLPSLNQLAALVADIHRIRNELEVVVCFLLDRCEAAYPFHDQTLTVTHCGPICFKGQKVNLSQVFAGQNVGVTQVGEPIWLVTFMHYDLGHFDDETCRLEPIENPFGPKVLPMSSE
ncbi:MAG TPA: hypothetical protein VHU82_00665 [Vicinamibacterales bacterium]|nr:hypothetical protein [Vicinamibacterales bacterium]